MLHHSTLPKLPFSACEHHSRVAYPTHYIQTLLQEEASPFRRLPPLFSALEVLDAYPALRELLESFPPHLHYALKARLVSEEPYQKVRLKMLDMLLSADDIMDIVNEAGPVPLSILHHEVVFGFIEGMLLQAWTYRRELAFLFTQIPIHHLPPFRAIAPSTAPSLTLLPTYTHWFLCSQAESRLSQAMRDQAVLLVHGGLLLKFHGRMSGLAVQSLILANGTQLVAGCWYAPLDHREQLREAFDRGESHVFDTEGQWVLIRALEDTYDISAITLLQQAQAYAAAMPNERLSPQIEGMSRSQYWREYHESF